MNGILLLQCAIVLVGEISGQRVVPVKYNSPVYTIEYVRRGFFISAQIHEQNLRGCTDEEKEKK